MVSSIFNICSCFLYFTELTWLQNRIENNPLHCSLDWYWCILFGYTRCSDVFFMVSSARGTGTWTNVKFPPTRDLIRVKCPGGMGIFGFDSYINAKSSVCRSRNLLSAPGTFSRTLELQFARDWNNDPRWRNLVVLLRITTKSVSYSVHIPFKTAQSLFQFRQKWFVFVDTWYVYQKCCDEAKTRAQMPSPQVSAGDPRFGTRSPALQPSKQNLQPNRKLWHPFFVFYTIALFLYQGACQNLGVILFSQIWKVASF